MARRIFIWVFTAVVALGVAYGVQSFSSNAPMFMSDDAVRERMLREVNRHPEAGAFLAKFEELFPEDHARFVDEMVRLYRAGASEEEAFNAGQTQMNAFMDQNKSHVMAAEPEMLRRVGVALTDGMGALSTENPGMCAQVLRSGAVSPQAAMSLSPRGRQAMTNITLVMLDAIASGRRAPTQYVDPSQAELERVVQIYQQRGGDIPTLDAFGDPARMARLGEGAVCQTGHQLWSAVMAMPGDFVPRFVSYSMRQGG